MCRLISFLSLTAALLCGCTGDSPTSSTATVINTNLHAYQVFGVVREIEPDGKTVRIRHEEIPGYMAAMTMPFEVRDTNELRGISAGDVVGFRMWVTEDDGWIDRVQKIGRDAAFVPPPPTNGNILPPGFRIVRDVEPLAVGDMLPDYWFTNQTGRAISLGGFRGRALAITFIFTRCPYPLFCPRMMDGFTQTQEKLLARANAPTNWHLLSLTIDPEFDTPQLLRAYGAKHGFKPEWWSLTTGTVEDVTAIGDQFGLIVQRDAPGALPNHNLRTIVVEPSGRIRRIIPDNKWSAEELAEELFRAARGEPSP